MFVLNVNLLYPITLEPSIFVISTAHLPYDTYTLTLTSVLDRASWTDTDILTYTFIKRAPSSCVAEGIITFADGSQKPVEDLTMDDMLLVWNHHTETLTLHLWCSSTVSQYHEIIHLYF